MDPRAPYLFFDTETGGVDANQHSLLSLGLVVGDASQITAQAEIFIRHDPYVVTAGGLEVNRIDLVTHHTWALAPMEAWVEMNTFLSAHFAPDEPIILVGHNIGFDWAFLDVFLRGLGQGGSRRFSHRSIDTHAIASALRDAGKIPATVPLHSSGLFDHFQINIPHEQRHTALGDAVGTFHLYWSMVELAK